MLAFIGKAVPIALGCAVIVLGVVNYLRYRREVERGDGRASKTNGESVALLALGIAVLVMAAQL